MTSQGFRINDYCIVNVKNDVLDELLCSIEMDQTMNFPSPPQSFPPPAEYQSSPEYLNHVHHEQANPVQRDYFPTWNYFSSSVSVQSSTSSSNHPFHIGPETDRSCEACGTYSTPEWRNGPDGRKSLCNACGLRFSRNLVKKRKQEEKKREVEIKLLLSRKMENKASKEMVKKLDHIPKNNASIKPKQ